MPTLEPTPEPSPAAPAVAETTSPAATADAGADTPATDLEAPEPLASSEPVTTPEPVEGLAAVEPVEPVAPLEPVAAIPAAPVVDAIPAAPDTAVQTAAVPGLEGGLFGVEDGPSRVSLNAIQDSWVQVRDAGGELLLTRVLRAGEIYRVPDEPGLTLVTGNAGGLEILVDGESLGIMGPVGKVRRDVNLSAEALKANLGGG